MSWNKPFMENKGHRNPRACVRRHMNAYACPRPAYASFMHTYAYMGMHTHSKILETMKDKFSALKLRF
mgnify:CR=1 FL=1